MFDREAYRQKMQWFEEARFGMFIHWGLYAIPARGEWVRCHERISNEDYQKYFDAFDPTDYNPKEWARLAKAAGMQYAVLTTKHHDGFCLFDSALTDYKATNTKAKRDLVHEYVEAFRAEGIKIGFYYSLIDWHHEGYPHYGDRFHPMRENEAFKDRQHDFDTYTAYFHGQVRELLTNYGRIDLMWFDFSYGEMTGEKWKATELVRMMRSIQPHIIIDNRLSEGTKSVSPLSEVEPPEYAGDFSNPEQAIPPMGLTDDQGNPIHWEACITMNNNWGYAAADGHYKPAPMVVKKLVECVSKNGNLLLNVGPDARGMISAQSVAILDKVGQWMAKNSASIYGCGYADINKPEYGRITRKGNKLYYHVMENCIGGILLHGVKAEDIAFIRLLADHSELKISNNWFTKDFEGVFVMLGESPILPDEVDTVIEVTLR